MDNLSVALLVNLTVYSEAVLSDWSMVGKKVDYLVGEMAKMMGYYLAASKEA